MIGRREMIALAALTLAAGPVPARTPARILAFGDSLTAGYGLKPDAGLVPVLTRWLAENGRPVQVVNGGLSGDTTYGGRVRIGWSLLRGADAVIVELGGNDMLIGIPPENTEANLDAILTHATSGGRPVLLVGVPSPAKDDAERLAWAAIWPRLAERHGALLWPDLYAPIAALPPQKRTAMLQSDGVHPSAEGVRLIVEALGPSVLNLIAQLPSSAAPPDHGNAASVRTD